MIEEAVPDEDAGAGREPVARSYFERPSSVPAAPVETAEAPVRAPAEARPAVVDTVAAPAPSAPPAAAVAPMVPAAALPKVVSFKLPMEELIQVAEQSGLHWVNSDADKIAAVQAAIAAEPARLHVPRERPPIVVTDEGPLVLVETRKDLRNLSLPF